MIQLVGEGYEEEITLENIHSFLTEETLESMMGEKEELSGEYNPRPAHERGRT